MKKLLITILTAFCAISHAQLESITVTAPTNFVAATTIITSQKGATVPLPQYGLSSARILVGAPCTVAGAGTNGDFVVYLETAQSKTGPWSSWTNSNIKVTVPMIGQATNMHSERFDLSGIGWLRVGAVSNSSAGIVTNFYTLIVGPQPISHR